MNNDYISELPADYYFGGGGSDTFSTPLATSFMILAIILMIALPRKYVIVPFMLAGLLIPLPVSLVFLRFHFNSSRILLLAGWIRILTRGERYPNRLNSLDKTILYGTLANAVAFSLVWGKIDAVVNRAGFLFSALGTYFLLRSLIRSKEDIIRVIMVLLLVVTMVAPLMWYEHITQHNLFSLVGAPEISLLRGGRVRAQGPFAHSIIAGTFGVVLVPLFVGIWRYNPHTWIIATVGIASSTAMMISSSSTTPVMALPAGILALLMWPLREKMRFVRWGIVAMFIGLQLVMKSPIWFLLNRVSGTLGGSGWHRTMLIDNFVHHFFDWFLIGTRDNANWGWSMFDVDNAYVAAGLMGGMVGFILFLAVFVYAYRMIGNARIKAEKSHRDASLIWSIGAAIFANSIAFFGIVYFDQSAIAWYALLVMVSAVSTFAGEEYPVSAGPGMAGTLSPVTTG